MGCIRTMIGQGISYGAGDFFRAGACVRGRARGRGVSCSGRSHEAVIDAVRVKIDSRTHAPGIDAMRADAA
jgi:hypothetical protein